VETAAGGRLLNVIVDDEQVGKALLEKGQLGRRWTMIPLSQISTAASIPSVLQKRAVEEVGEGQVAVALDVWAMRGRSRRPCNSSLVPLLSVQPQPPHPS